MTIIYLLLVLSGFFLAALLGLRVYDWRADQMEWTRLSSLQPERPMKYDPAMVTDLPEAAQRYFNFTIRPGTPLITVAEIRMGGFFSLGSRDAPDYRTMNARQILATPNGFVWQLRLPGGLPVSGSDSAKWTRFRILGLLPVARMGGTPDHRLSAYGRYIAESVFWTPAALLPGPGVCWQGIDSDTASVTVNHGSLSQTVELTVDADGRPVSVSFMRWSNANPERQYRYQPFSGLLSEYREVQGFRLPFHVEAGNMFGTDDYFAFYKAEVSMIQFPK